MGANASKNNILPQPRLHAPAQPKSDAPTAPVRPAPLQEGGSKKPSTNTDVNVDKIIEGIEKQNRVRRMREETSAYFAAELARRAGRVAVKKYVFICPTSIGKDSCECGCIQLSKLPGYGTGGSYIDYMSPEFIEEMKAANSTTARS